MKRLFITFATLYLLMLSGCAIKTSMTPGTSRSLSNFAFEPNGGFIPVEPDEAKSMIEILKDGKMQTVDIRTLSNDQLRAHLTSTDQYIKISKADSTGKLTYLTGSVSGEKGHYVAIMDFSNYFIDGYADENNKEIGKAKIGIGLRMIANVHTKKKGINLGSLFSIGIAASKQELTGELTVKLMGLTSKEIINLTPGSFTSINETTIQKALEGIAAVKAKIYDEDTRVSARILSVRIYKDYKGIARNLQPPSL